MALEQTWRWFGPEDPVSLEEIKQSGATGIVTALHHIHAGEIWTVEEIQERNKRIKEAGFTWSVVESVPVHEDIKKGRKNSSIYIDNYKQTIINLGHCGIDTICYNFMPVLDWSRTDLKTTGNDGAIFTAFSADMFAAFDLFILKRPDADNSYSSKQIENARQYYEQLDNNQKDTLIKTILLGHPGSLETYTLDELRTSVIEYRKIGELNLRNNLYNFIREIIPVAQASGVRMAIHPDDPPWSLLGLPRVVGNQYDIEKILNVNNSHSNGLTLCTGSLGADIKNDLASLADKFAGRINFIHLRNVSRKSSGDFKEERHLEGDVDIYDIMRILLLEQIRRMNTGRQDFRLPMRPDHGPLTLADKDKKGIYPGYSLFGRMRGLAELRGLELGIQRTLNL